jgi:hypothetical protein
MRLEMKLLAFEPGMPKFRSIRIPLIRMPIPKDRAEHGGDSAPPVKAADIEAQRRKHRGSRIWQISVPVLNDDGGDVSEADVYVALLARAGDVWHILIPVRIFCSRHSEALGLDSNKQ